MRDSKSEYFELLDSLISYSRIEIFDSPSCNNNFDFWMKLGNNLEYLKMDFNDNFHKFTDILEYVPNLQFLDIHFRDVKVVEESYEIVPIRLTKLTNFIFHMDKYCSSIILSHLLPMMEQVEYLALEIDLILLKPGRRSLVKYLNEGRNRIKSLKVFSDARTLRSINNKVVGMNLITCSLCAQDSFQLSNEFTNPLKLLNLGLPNFTRMVNNISFIANTFTNLETLKFQYDLDENITDLKRLTKLQVMLTVQVVYIKFIILIFF